MVQPQLQVGAEHTYSDPKGNFPRAAPREGESLDHASGGRRGFGGTSLSQEIKLSQVTQHSCRQSAQLSGGARESLKGLCMQRWGQVTLSSAAPLKEGTDTAPRSG